ncbi:uncharacterized protein [Physcomitrium patens]|uniref:uncharacterized protein isoform X4 n=1 Tax=Physcomitrium patens TaxID=3218 RepID=UPI003CCCDE4A
MRTYLAVCIFMCGFTSADSLIGRCLGPTSAALKDQRVKTKIEWAVWIATEQVSITMHTGTPTSQSLLLT